MIEIGFVNKGYTNHSVHVLVDSGNPTWPWKPLCGQRMDLAAMENDQGRPSDVTCKRCASKLADRRAEIMQLIDILAAGHRVLVSGPSFLPDYSNVLVQTDTTVIDYLLYGRVDDPSALIIGRIEGAPRQQRSAFIGDGLTDGEQIAFTDGYAVTLQIIEAHQRASAFKG